MIDLVRLRLKNFLSFEEADIDLSKPGLYLISGWNDRGNDSNGSGKSTILDGICYALFGKTVTGLGPSEVQRWDTQDTEVELWLRSNTSEFTIARRNNDIEFLRDGGPSQPTIHKRDIQHAINSTFQTSYEIFTSSTYFANRTFLAAQSDAEKKKLFKPIFQLDRLDIAYAECKAKYDEATTNLDNLTQAITQKERLNEERTRLVSQYEEQSAKWSVQLNDTLSGLREAKKNITVTLDKTIVKRVDDLSDKAEMLQEDIDAHVDLVESWNAEWQDKKVARTVAEAKYTEVHETLEDIISFKGGEECTYCGQPLTEEKLAEYKTSKAEELNAQLAELSRTVVAHKNRCDELDRQLLNFSAKQERLNLLKGKIADARANLALQKEQIEYNKKRLADLDKRIEEEAGKAPPFEAMIEDTRAKIKATESDIKASKTLYDKLNSTADVLNFLKWVFSKEGVSSYIIERAFGRLESLANRYLGAISSEGFQLEIKPQKELKSKAIKEQIDIVVTVDGKRVTYWGLSGGQRQRLNIALLLAVYRLCRDLGINNFDFLLLDEVLDLSLADKGQADTVRLLRRLLGTEVDKIFIISHRPDVVDDFDRVIEVRRGMDKISRIVS
jgi:DNA repair exonuclease SbcCD ATPase subunit